ncbi:MAG: 4Fe-4S binding protein [Peptococcaceae bacterium]|nr:4Fe-4S binding protein [Candidatus Syntrophopropionicum ammoniitolerans]
MVIEEIYKAFDRIGCLTFATIDGDYPETRIAHLFAWDEEGLYFRTMRVKPFYRQLMETRKISICGMSASPRVRIGEDGLPNFEPGYTIKATGDVKEIPFAVLQKKADIKPIFRLGVKDTIKYPDTVTFCIYRFKGDYYNYDYDCHSRDHKIIRKHFNFGYFPDRFKGLKINVDLCTKCGKCEEICQSINFKAVYQTDSGYAIDIDKCDVCGSCSKACPVNAIESYC